MKNIDELVAAAQSAGASEFQNFWDQVRDRIAVIEGQKQAEDLVQSRDLTERPSSNTI